MSTADVQVFTAIKAAPDATKYPHASRWYNHIRSFSDEERKLYVQYHTLHNDTPKRTNKLIYTTRFRAGSVPVSTTTTTTTATEEKKEELNLFGDDEEDDEEYEKQLAARRDAALAAKGGKKKEAFIAKSSLLLDVKPWDDETPMEKLEECVRSITMEGLLWGACMFYCYPFYLVANGTIIVLQLNWSLLAMESRNSKLTL